MLKGCVMLKEIAGLFYQIGKDIFEDTFDKEKILLNAIKAKDLDSIRQCLQNGTTQSALDKALCSACSNYGSSLYGFDKNEMYNIIELLIKNGANVNTALSSVIYYDSYDWNLVRILKILVENGANVNTICGTDFVDAFSFFCLVYSRLQSVKYLVSKGININAKGQNGNTLLMNATSYSAWVYKYNPNVLDYKEYDEQISKEILETVKFLVENGAYINARNNDGETALHCATKGELSVVKFLVESGIDMNARNNNGETALGIAQNGKIMEFLQSVGAVR